MVYSMSLTPVEQDEIVRLYAVEKLGCQAIAKRCKRHVRTVLKTLRKANVVLRTKKESSLVVVERLHGTKEEVEHRRQLARQQKSKQQRIKIANKANQFLQAYFATHPCVDCGNANLLVLTFDHRDPKEKLDDVSRLKRKSIEVMKTEIAKCDVVCFNCHAIRTANMFGSWRLQKDVF